jgi:hypothetical protein
MRILKDFISELATWANENHQTLQPVLVWIYQNHAKQFESKTESVNALRSFVSSVPKQLIENIIDEIQDRKHQSELAWRKAVCRFMPFPSTTHWELLTFGRRLDRRCEWARLGRAAHHGCFVFVRSGPPLRRLSPDEARKIGARIADRDAEVAFRQIWGFNTSYQFVGVDNIDQPFEYKGSETEKKAAEVSGIKNTGRSRANAGRHNIERFAKWIRNQESERERSKILRAWAKQSNRNRAEIMDRCDQSSCAWFYASLSTRDDGATITSGTDALPN